MDLPGHGEDPPLVGTLLLPALAREGQSIDIRQLAVAGTAHHELAAATLSRVGLLAKGLVRGLVALTGPQRELDEPEPRFARAARTSLQLRNLDVLESQVSNLKEATGSVRSALGRQLLALRFLILAAVQPCIIGRRRDATLEVVVVPEAADRHQAGEAVRHLHFHQAVRVRVEPVNPARMVAGDHVAVADVAVLGAREARSGIQRAGISLRIPGTPRRTGVRVAGRAAACSGSLHEDAIAVDAVATGAFESGPFG